MITRDKGINNIEFSSIFEELEGYAIYEIDLEGKVISWNDTAERVKGFTKNDVLGNTIHLFFTEKDLENNTPDKLLKKAKKEGKASSQGWRKKKNGHLFWAKSTVKLVNDNSGSPLRFIKITRDLTNNKELEKNYEQGRIFVEQSVHAMAMFDTEMRYLALSNRFKKDYGLENTDVIGKSHYDIFPDMKEEWKPIHQECLKGSIRSCSEDKYERENGDVFWLSWDLRPWYSSESVIGGLLLSTEDITAKKKIEESFKINSQQFKGAFDNSPIGMALVSLEGQWIDVNKEICQTLGYTETEMFEKTFQDITHPDDLEKDLSYLHKTISGEIDNYKMEKRYFHKNGNIIWAMLSVSLVRDDSNNPLHFVSMVEDITEKKEAEEALKKVNTELNAILNSTHVSIISTDVDGIITNFNKGAEELLGYTAEEMIGKNSPAIIHKTAEVVVRGKQLSEFYNKKIEGFEVFVHKAREGHYESREWTYIKKNGTEFKVQLVVTAIYDNTGKVKGFIGVATDITSLIDAKKKLEKSKHELETLAERLTKQNNQLLNFAHITSHNLRAPVSNLQALIDIYNNADDEITKVEVFEHLNNTVINLSTTLDQLMTSLKVQKEAIKDIAEIDIEECVNKVLNGISNEIIKSNATITKDFTAFNSIPYNRIYFESIIQNLITNAIRYRSTERSPLITIKTEILKGKKTLIVKDNGIGIDLKRHGNKIFGLYKTFHRHKDARGVGLFITKTQVEAMGGNIFVESIPDKETVFYIEFN